MGIYLVNNFQIKNFTINSGFRYDLNRIEMEDLISENINLHDQITLKSFNPSLGINFKINKNSRIFINTSSGFETPTLNEYSASPIGSGFNKDLKSQKNMGYELGASLFNLSKKFLSKNNKLNDDWNPINILSVDAATVGNLDLDIIDKNDKILDELHENKFEIIFLLGQDNLDFQKKDKDNRELSEVIKNKISVFIKEKKISKNRIIGIGLSGQTVRYQKYKKSFISMQLAEPNLISAYFKIPVIFDFRNSHISHGGMGAPLVKDFHIEVAGKVINKFAFINLGGIANYSVKKGASSWGTDTGPANALMDEYCKNYLNKSFDRDGAIASKGKIHEKIIHELMDHAFFKKKYPKTTGKEDFNLSIIPKKFLKKLSNRMKMLLGFYNYPPIDEKSRVTSRGKIKNYILNQCHK